MLYYVDNDILIGPWKLFEDEQVAAKNGVTVARLYVNLYYVFFPKKNLVDVSNLYKISRGPQVTPSSLQSLDYYIILFL